MTASSHAGENAYLTRSLPKLFVTTATPIIFIMGMNGLLTVIDAYFLGEFVGAEALTAVTLMFPVYMLLVSLSTIVAGGLASVLARLLGAGDHAGARRAFVSAHALAILVCGLLVAGFLLAGSAMTRWVANGSAPLAAMGYTYISILIFCSPIAFALSLNADALRCEGRMGLMAAVSLATSLANIAFNYCLIVVFDYGVAGSAVGTVLAQTAALGAVVVFRLRGRTVLRLQELSLEGWNRGWKRLLALGAPQSLSFIGISLGSAAIIYALQLWAQDNYAATVAAYGVMTRLLTFSFLPLMGLSASMQTIAGNNFGASLWHRSDGALRLGAVLALLYCAGMQSLFFFLRGSLGAIFVDDPATIAEVERILPIATMMYFVAGPLLVLSGYFQSIGDAGRSALLSLTRTYLFAIPLTFCLPVLLGETGIWLAGPTSELLMVVLATVLLATTRRRTGHRWGVFRTASG